MRLDCKGGGVFTMSNGEKQDELIAELTRLKAEKYALERDNARLRASVRGAPLEIRVSPKRAVSIYGLQRWPTTLYQEQMIRLLDHKEEILKFIADNQAELKQTPKYPAKTMAAAAGEPNDESDDSEPNEPDPDE